MAHNTYMNKDLTKENIERQYKNPDNLAKRKNLHDQFGTNKYDWYQWVFDHFDFPRDAKILELGCGLGNLWSNNKERIGKGWGITLSDFSEEMLTSTKNALAAIDHDFSFEVINADHIPYADGTFDVVIANGLLYLVPDLQKTISEISRALKPGGILIASTSGSKYMIELEELLKTSGLPVHHTYTSYSFSLDNGTEVLSPYFSNVTLYRRDDGLLVTEAEPLATRILSTNDALSEPDRRQVYDYFDSYFKNHDSLKITLDTGLFVAKK